MTTRRVTYLHRVNVKECKSLIGILNQYHPCMSSRLFFFLRLCVSVKNKHERKGYKYINHTNFNYM